MAKIRKLSVIGFSFLTLGLSLVWAGHSALSRMTLHVRPRLLEADIRSRLAECRTGAGTVIFTEEREMLETRALEAESCLAATDAKIWFRRDYAPCISTMAAIELDAKLLRLRMEQREQDQRKILDALISSLKFALTGRAAYNKIWVRFNLSGIEEARARSLLEEAEVFYAQDEIEMSFYAALNAWNAWDRFSSKNDLGFARFSNASLRAQWSRQVNRLLQWSEQHRKRAIIIDKFEHACLLIDKGKLQKSYRADLGRQWFQRKSRSQDAATPEGDYFVTSLIPRGNYGRALLINYPNDEDRARFRSLKSSGEISAGAQIGGRIEIHGGGGKHTDWTDGCISLRDSDMREIYSFAYPGMPVTIVGISRWSRNAKE
jgi:hypothetical protein